MHFLNRSIGAGFLLSALAFLPATALAGVDSFFDIHYEVTFDKVAGSPVVRPQAFIRDTHNGSRSVETEMLSMSLTSRSSGEGHSSHVAILSYVANIGSSGEDGVRRKRNHVEGFARLEITCNRGMCLVTDAEPISRGKHRGHVTVLK